MRWTQRAALFAAAFALVFVVADSGLSQRGRGGKKGGAKGGVKRVRPTPVKLNVYADNWFKLYVNGELIAVDSIAFVPHNVISVDVIETYPMTIAVLAKDFADPDTGLEWNNSQIGDGGFLLKLGANIVSGPHWKAKKFSWGPLDGNMDNPKVVHRELPKGWEQPGFDDSAWANAVEFSVQQIRPRTNYQDYDFEGAKFIWTEDLELDNTILFRYRIDAPPSR